MERIGWLLAGAGFGVVILWTVRGLRGGGNDGEASGALSRLVASEDRRIAAVRHAGQATGPLPRLAVELDRRRASLQRNGER